MLEEMGGGEVRFNGLTYEQAKRERDHWSTAGQFMGEGAIYAGVIWLGLNGQGAAAGTLAVANFGLHGVKQFIIILATPTSERKATEIALEHSPITWRGINAPRSNLSRGRQNLVSLTAGVLRTHPGMFVERMGTLAGHVGGYFARSLSFKKHTQG